MRQFASFHVSDVAQFKLGLLYWAQRFDEFLWLDGNQGPDAYGSFDCLMAVEAADRLTLGIPRGAFDRLREFQEMQADWIFGYLAYDLKNDLEALESCNPDGLNFPELHFFRPRRIIRLKGGNAEFYYLGMDAEEMQRDFSAIEKAGENGLTEDIHQTERAKIRLRMSKDEYFSRVRQFLGHIHRGDIYEANFCQEFYAENTVIDPLKTYQRLNARTQSPFSAFMKLGEAYLICASPERYLKKRGRQLVAQPMKGTAARAADRTKDELLKANLEQDPKERSENIMIVDLVRNDLSRKAAAGSVKVTELCRVYSYRQAHQMVSTIVAEAKEDTGPVDFLKATFPMGSMTGAPKVSAMKIIESLEMSKRGLYSGAVGYFDPKGNFDFNVVIRSILYHKGTNYVSFSVGSAITARSIPEKEYQECLLKARAMREALQPGP